MSIINEETHYPVQSISEERARQTADVDGYFLKLSQNTLKRLFFFSQVEGSHYNSIGEESEKESFSEDCTVTVDEIKGISILKELLIDTLRSAGVELSSSKIFSLLSEKVEMQNKSLIKSHTLNILNNETKSPISHIVKTKKNKFLYVGSKKAHLTKRINDELKEQGFVIDCNGVIKQNEFLVKESIRSLHSEARRQKFEEKFPRLKNKEQLLTRFFADGVDIDVDEVDPKIEVVNSGTWQNDLFNYSTLLWSVPVSQGYGRRTRFLVWDRNNGKLIGIFALGDPVLNLNCRDQWIGWGIKQRLERLYNVMDIFVLGAVPPYNSLLGGKLIALLATSTEVSDIIEKKYENRRTLIDKKLKDPKLALLTTGSALGKSSIYDRIKYKDRKMYHKIGVSNGWGHFHFSNNLFMDMRTFLSEIYPHRGDLYKFGNGPNWKLRTVRETLKALSMPQNLLKHGINREIYGVPLAENFTQFLNGAEGELRSTTVPSNDITLFFKERWMIQRSLRRSEYRGFKKEEIASMIRKLGGDRLSYD